MSITTESSTFNLGAALGEPLTAIAYRIGPQLRALYPDRAMIEGESCSFDLNEFADSGHCVLCPVSSDIYNQIDTDWIGPQRGLSRTRQNVWYNVAWQGHSLEIILLQWPQAYSTTSHHWIIAPTTEIAEQFFTAVCEQNAVIEETVLVFNGGGWQKSRELFVAIQKATFDNLILSGNLKEDVRQDLMRFLAGRETYARYGVPWKRGVLLIGPPGNGKTHMVKALINAAGNVPCLYVKSFKKQHGTDHDAIRSVFHRARQVTPCILVLEDLDSLIDDGNRSFFLNELDGFASNDGIVTLATTNHPERLDTAIVDRPSRFDRKYHFDLPAVRERAAYISHWNGGLQVDLQLTSSGIAHAADLTDGFSFAYLKELFLTSLMRWIDGAAMGSAGDAPTLTMDAVIVEQIALLRSQMSTMNTLVEAEAAVLGTDDSDEE